MLIAFSQYVIDYRVYKVHFTSVPWTNWKKSTLSILMANAFFGQTSVHIYLFTTYIL